MNPKCNYDTIYILTKTTGKEAIQQLLNGAQTSKFNGQTSKVRMRQNENCDDSLILPMQFAQSFCFIECAKIY